MVTNVRPLGIVDEPYGARVNLRQTLDAVLEQAPGLFANAMDSLIGKEDKLKKPGAGFGSATHVRPNFAPHVQAQLDILYRQTTGLQDHFTERLRYYIFLGVGSTAQSPQTMRFEDLKLFEEEDLDESIEVAAALQEITRSTDDVIAQVNALVSSLLGWITVQAQINPLRPEMFARALRDCIIDRVEDVESRNALISHAAARLGIGLRKLYAELCQWLKSYGVEEASTAQVVTLPGVNKAAAGTGVSGSVARTLLTLDRLRRLLSGELDGDTKRNQDFLHTVPASVVALQDMRQVEAMVQRLERKAQTAADDPSSEEAKQQALVKARMSLKDGRELGKQLGEEVIRLMLDNLIADERLLPRVRHHLSHLEPLLMVIAQEDGRFFSDKEHAARQYLDAVTNRSLGFGNEREDGYAAFVQTVEQSVSMLHSKTQTGESVPLAFSDVLDRLTAVWARLDAAENLRREEAARALLHAEQRNTIANYLAQDFRMQAEGAEIPNIVIDFCSGPWAHAVAESQLRCTDGRTDPQGYQQLVSELYWSVQPAKAKRNRRRLVQLIPSMLAKLRQGLVMIEFPAERITDFFAELIRLHEEALEGSKPKPVAVKPQQAEGLDVQEATESMFDDAIAAQQREELQAIYDASAQAPLDALGGSGGSGHLPTQPDSLFGDFPSSQFQAPGQANDQKPQVWMGQHEAQGVGFVTEELAAHISVSAPHASSQVIPISPEVTLSIPIGSWVELMLEGSWIRAQLTWASPMRTLFMFVSRGGKAHSMSKRTMDKLCAQGLIRMVSDGQLVDHALDAVAQEALKNSVDQNRIPFEAPSVPPPSKRRR